MVQADSASHPPTKLFGYDNAHRTGCAFNLLHSAFEVDRIEIFHLQFSDLFHLGAGHLANLFLVRNAGALFDLCGFAKQNSSGRGPKSLTIRGCPTLLSGAMTGAMDARMCVAGAIMNYNTTRHIAQKMPGWKMACS